MSLASPELLSGVILVSIFSSQPSVECSIWSCPFQFTVSPRAYAFASADKMRLKSGHIPSCLKLVCDSDKGYALITAKVNRSVFFKVVVCSQKCQSSFARHHSCEWNQVPHREFYLLQVTSNTPTTVSENTCPVLPPSDQCNNSGYPDDIYWCIPQCRWVLFETGRVNVIPAHEISSGNLLFSR